ncbi:response regulator transcription factor [Clostridium sardiniense]|nr:response regulator [Clostridium sardiniense]MDQ0459835.1 two-component system response regulator YesN [Clostridium sardiniense]
MINVILADDESLEIEALKIIINKKFNNARVVGVANSGEEALSLTEKLNPDVIFISVSIPGINGFDVAKIIKKKYPDKKIVLMSIYDDFEFVKKALKIKVDDYILKPIRAEKIVEVLDEFINTDKGYCINKNKNNFLEGLREGDYKKSKDNLGELIINLKELSMCVAKDYYEQILCDINDAVTFRNNKINKAIEYKNTLRSCTSINDIENNLITILDDLFDILINEEDGSSDYELKYILNYIEKNFRSNIMLQDVANHIKVSTPYLSKTFKKHMGTNFNRYVTNRRIEEAKHMLSNTNISISELTFNIGYNEPNYFCKVFKKIEGMTPLEYREKFKNT